MNFLKKVFFGLMLTIGISACSNEETIEINPESILKSEMELVVKYNGRTFFTGVAFQNDSAIYLNKEYAEVYAKEISKAEDLAIFFHEDEFGREIVEYYNSTEKLEQEKKISYIENQECIEITEDSLSCITRGSNTVHIVPFNGAPLGTAQLWDDKDYSDRSVLLQCSDKMYQRVASLRDFADFNDKTSSIKVWSYIKPSTYYSSDYNSSGVPGRNLRTCLISFSDSNFKGNKLYCISNPSGDPNPHEDRRLKSIGWNDKISSVIFTIIRIEEIGTEFFPHN